MTIIKARIIGLGTQDNPKRVNLPSYQMVGEINAAGICDIIIPDDELNASKTRPNAHLIRAKYRGQVLWDRVGVAGDVWV